MTSKLQFKPRYNSTDFIHDHFSSFLIFLVLPFSMVFDFLAFYFFNFLDFLYVQIQIEIVGVQNEMSTTAPLY